MEANAVTLRSLGNLPPPAACRRVQPEPLGSAGSHRAASPGHLLRGPHGSSGSSDDVLGRLSVKEVAARLGYDDPYHFSRLFKAVHGLPCVAFRSLYG